MKRHVIRAKLPNSCKGPHMLVKMRSGKGWRCLKCKYTADLWVHKEGA